MSLIPIVDAAGAVVDALDTASPGVALIQEQINPKMVDLLAKDELERDDPFDTDFAILRDWQLFRRDDASYIFCEWTDGDIYRNYAGFAVTAQWAATMFQSLGIQVPDIVLADMMATPRPMEASEAAPVLGAIRPRAGADRQADSTPPAEADHKQATHSIDFRSVNWYGTPYWFTANQAACVEVWWKHSQQGTPDVGDAAVLEAAEIMGNRLDLLFRGCKAWGTMIVAGETKGTHRLQAPPCAK